MECVDLEEGQRPRLSLHQGVGIGRAQWTGVQGLCIVQVRGMLTASLVTGLTRKFLSQGQGCPST